MADIFKNQYKIFTVFFIFLLLTGCPNEMMRDLVEQKLSDPVADTFVINSGAPTASLEVTLNSKVTKDNDSLQMRFRNEGGSWSDWASYSDSASWTLPIGDGTKTVYAEYRDEGHNVVGMQSNIVLNTGAPAGDFYVWGSAVSGNRHLYVNSTSVTLCMTISNVASMRFSNTSDAGPWSSWIPYSSTTPWTLTGDGSKTIYAEFQTNAGTTTPSSRNITLDTTPPSVTGFVINNGLATANSTSAELDYNYTEANNLWVQYMNDGGSWSSQEVLAAGSAVPVNKSWALRAVTGDRSVSVRLYDIAGNISSVYSDLIYLSTAAPGVPVVTGTTPTNDTTPTWTWEEVAGAVSYDYRLDGGEGTTTTETSYTPSSSLSFGSHTLGVTSRDIAGNVSEEGTHSISIIPPAPTGLAVSSAAQTSITLQWNISLGASSYQLYRDTSAGGSFTTQVYSGANNSYTNTGLSSGTTYYYKVRSTYPAAVSPLSSPAVSALTIPQTPSPPAMSGQSLTTITLNWPTVTGTTNYKVFRDINSGGTFSTQAYTGVSSSFTDSGLSPGTHYYYKVQAGNASGYSPLSVSSGTCSTTISPPSNLTASVGSSFTHVALTWSSVTNAHSYTLARRTLAGSFSTIQTIIAPITSYNDTTAAAGTTYVYRIFTTSPDGVTSLNSSEAKGYRAISGALPNLTLSLTIFARTESQVNSIYRITNSGTAHVDLAGPDHNDWHDTVAIQNYFSANSIYGDGDDRAAGGSVIYLGPNPENLPVLLPGEYFDYNYFAGGTNSIGEYLFALVDQGNKVAESNEGDNVGSVVIFQP
jgi:fibronectin type 3 domain-containing protein